MTHPAHYTLREALTALGKLLFKEQWDGQESHWYIPWPDAEEGLLGDWLDYLEESPDIQEALSGDEIAELQKERYPSYARFVSTRDALFEHLHAKSIQIVFFAPNGDDTGQLPNRLWQDQTGEFTVDLWDGIVHKRIGTKTEQWRVRIPKPAFDAFLVNFNEPVTAKKAGRREWHKSDWLRQKFGEMIENGSITPGTPRQPICERLASQHDMTFGVRKSGKSLGKGADAKTIRRILKPELDAFLGEKISS